MPRRQTAPRHRPYTSARTRRRRRRPVRAPRLTRVLWLTRVPRRAGARCQAARWAPLREARPVAREALSALLASPLLPLVLLDKYSSNKVSTTTDSPGVPPGV